MSRITKKLWVKLLGSGCRAEDRTQDRQNNGLSWVWSWYCMETRTERQETSSDASDGLSPLKYHTQQTWTETVKKSGE